MYSKTPPSKNNKRPREESSIERPRKSPIVNLDDDDPKVFKFRILCPNGTSLELKMSVLKNEMPIEEFIDTVKKEYYAFVNQRRSQDPHQSKRRIDWKYQDLHFADGHGNKIKTRVNFRGFTPNDWHFLWLHDGSAEPDSYEDMWDLTPDTDLLKELPDDYTFETALADLIDNSLQALWSNGVGQRRLISVELRPNGILIFDSGPGMDGADGNLVKWGKMGASLHRSVRGKAIGGKPPYLMPFFGMFGYGGPIAAMCLGRRAIVSSKTKNCNKVFKLHLEREALMSASHSENCWKTKGGMRDPLTDEKDKSPHGSFTKVQIFEPKMKTLNIKQLRCRLKDIYFPYIQCDEMSGKTSRPVEFEVNEEDLAEIQGGEVATTNLHSCNGPDFILQLHLSIRKETSSTPGPSQRVVLDANARLKCVYFPIVEGKENIQRIIEELEEDGHEIGESFEGFSRVSVRRLGRLLPDSRWAWLPFMEPKQKKGEKAQILKRCCSRVKCFIDTDSGFNPTPYKTDLAHHHPYTKALKNFGNKIPENEKDVQIEVFRDGKKLTSIGQLEKQYNDWVLEMHEQYDGEIDGGLDEATLIVVSSKIKKLGIDSRVLRVHKKIERKGKFWTAGQKIKVLKGACTGCNKNNIFATLEYIVLDGLPGDACGEARLIIRPLGLPEEKGCHLLVDNGDKTIDLRDSLSFPISVINSEKCIAIDDAEWENKLEMHRQKLPSAIDLLSDVDCEELEIEGGMLSDVIEAGDDPPENIVAVIRPRAFNSKSSSKKLDQRFIVRDSLEMSVVVRSGAGGENAGKPDHVYSGWLSPSSHKGIYGLYKFPVKEKCLNLFHTVGFYTFSFSLKAMKDVRLEREVQVMASADVGSWKVVSHKQDALYTVRVGSCFEPISVACCDRYNNTIPFTSVPRLTIKLRSDNSVLAKVHGMKVTANKSTMTIKDIVVETNKLDTLRPNYEATLNISSLDEAFSVDFPCQVIPGIPQKIVVHPQQLRTELIPGQIIEELGLELFDAYGNHVKEDEGISLDIDGFSFQDGVGIVRKVDADGVVDLSNILKVSKGYGKDVSLRVIYKKREIFKMGFQTETRQLRTVSKVFKNREAGSQLENIVFEVINPEGKVDETIHDEDKYGQSHTLAVKSSSFDIDDSVRYSFRHGRCTIRSIPLPQTEGIFSFSAAHSRYSELNLDIEVHVENGWQENHGNLRDFEDVGNPIFSPQNSCQNSLSPYIPCLELSEVVHENATPQSLKKNSLPLLDYSPPTKTPKPEHRIARNENSDILPIQSLGSQDLGIITASPLPCQKEVEDTLVSYGMKMGDHQSKLEGLGTWRSQVEQRISDLQASIDRNSHNVSTTSIKELTIKQIKSKSQSAAAVICKMHEEVPFEEGIIGVVALLGTVQSIELSRMLAQYLGEDQMLAIVCTDYAAAGNLETNTIPQFANEFGRSITEGYLALCIEDIRPIMIDPSANPQDPLPLPSPIMPDGNMPQGFLGYAVNMISIEASHSEWRTKSGYGLRETLFYRLFGELQVYKDRECMMMAKSCIKDGAISLDGGIIRGGIITGNGLVSLGHREPDVLFPVKNRDMTPQGSRAWEMMEVKKMELVEINRQIVEETKSIEIDREQFFIARENYQMLIASQSGSGS